MTNDEKIQGFIHKNLAFDATDNGDVVIIKIVGDIHGDHTGNHEGTQS